MALNLGIDPGRNGAFAVLDAAESTVEIYDMPQTTLELHDLIADLPKVASCVLEKLHAGPVMGRVTIARMFEDYGVLKGALAWKSIPVRLIAPAKWKPALGLSKDKNASREMAMQLWPDQADLFKRVKDDGRAEAALLAHWGSQKDTRRGGE